MTDIAVAHEHYLSRGGAEIVADRLAQVFEADLITGYMSDPSKSDEVTAELSQQSSLSGLLNRPLLRNLWYMFVWERAPVLRDYNIIIQSGNAPIWYVPDQNQTIIKYNHSPPRAAFDRFYEATENAGITKRLYLKFIRHLWTDRTDSVDLWVCNSDMVKQRTKKYLGISESKIRVVYPPVDVNQYEPTEGDDGYYLSLGRLDAQKRTDLILEAFEEIDEQLLIAGAGPDKEDLEQQAKPHDNIRLLGRVSDERKRSLLQRAKAVVFAAENEDFGIVPIESMAAGTPVLGVDDGFTQYQIQSGANGFLFDDDPESIRNTVQRFERSGVIWDGRTLHEFAQQFSIDRFERQMRQIVEDQRKDSIEPKIKYPAVIQ